MKLKRRSLHPRGKTGELHFPSGVGSSFKIEPPHSTKALLDMNVDRSGVNGLAVSAPYCEFDGAGTGTALNDRNCFVGRLPRSKRRNREENGAQNTKKSVHILAIIRGRRITLQ